jgi:multicomponent K+:H+ antiporter subunit G
MMQGLADLLTAALLLLGAGFALIGSIAILRLPDIFTRLHGPAKATTLGVGGVLLASILYFSTHGELSLHELLISIFLFITAPVSAHSIARAALHRRCRSVAPLADEDRPVSPGDRGSPADLSNVEAGQGSKFG